MDSRFVVGLCLAVSAVPLAAAAPAGAAPRPITGTLDQSGYTVIALAANGRAEAVRLRRGRFALRPPAETVTLHLRAADGTYAGPVVLRSAGRRALLGVRAGARLGRIEVRAGYARPARRPRRRWVDSRRSARARRGIPIGAGNFGRVRSRPVRRPAPGDRDIDGIPDRLDIDDDGDLILDKLERRRRVRAAQNPGQRDPFDLATALGVPFEKSANVNAGWTDAQIDPVLAELGFMSMAVPNADKVELDCGGSANPAPPPPLLGGLPYCSYGGTGRVDLPPPRNEPFPECCDSDDRDGFGTLEANMIGPDFRQFSLVHGATPAQIGTGDTLILRVTNGGQETKVTDMNQFIFATVPALRSYVDELGQEFVVRHPPQPGDPGTAANGFPAVDGPDTDEDVEVTLTLWRPQRRPTSDLECGGVPGCAATEWWDFGGLDITAASRVAQERTSDAGWCAQDAFATSDGNLVAGFPDPQGGGFRDTAASQRANPGNTLTYTLNLTKCLDRYGLSFAAGQTQTFMLEAFTPIAGGGSAGVDNTMSEVSFTRR